MNFGVYKGGDFLDKININFKGRFSIMEHVLLASLPDAHIFEVSHSIWTPPYQNTTAAAKNCWQMSQSHSRT
jgi:hypothetical protein